MALSTKPLENSFVKEVMSLSLWDQADPATVEALRELWSEGVSMECAAFLAMPNVKRVTLKKNHLMSPSDAEHLM